VEVKFHLGEASDEVCERSVGRVHGRMESRRQKAVGSTQKAAGEGLSSRQVIPIRTARRFCRFSDCLTPGRRCRAYQISAHCWLGFFAFFLAQIPQSPLRPVKGFCKASRPSASAFCRLFSACCLLSSGSRPASGWAARAARR
jgi:hypothetical protein